MSILNIVALLGGLALFLYGISLMGDGLNMAAGDKVQVVLYRLTSNPLKGILLGAGVTALIQSSTATSIMAIGFVNSGLMEFAKAVSIILGAIVGTSITGWIVSLSFIGQGGGWMSLLSTTFITGLFATVGILLFKFSKNKTMNCVGTVMLGFAVLMYGMIAMGDAMSPLRESPLFISLLTKFSNPLIGILVGLAFTAIIQSSSAAVGILQALSITGAVPFSVAYPMILGIAIGSAMPVLISSLGASLNARRTALTHLIADILGVVICGSLFYLANVFVHFDFMHAIMTPISIAALNTVFRIATVVILAPAIGLIVKLICFILKDEPEEEVPGDWDLLEDRFIQHPAVALEQCRTVVNSMAGYVKENISDALALMHGYDEVGYNKVKSVEKLVDQYEDNLGNYILQITAGELTQGQNDDVHQFLYAITDLERISDYAAHIAESTREVFEKDIPFSDNVFKEIKVMERALNDILDITILALKEDDQILAHRVKPLDERIRRLCAEMKRRHIIRLQHGICSRQSGFVFNDLITSYERVSGHCVNLSLALIALDQDAFDKHGYTDSEMAQKDEDYIKQLQKYKKRYAFPEIDAEGAYIDN